ncbi:MAG: hypothetical protein HFH85_13765 [Lachnospiraceae bacterium]|nr:hypothetical protein [Lachnospiraceae bacterium]
MGKRRIIRKRWFKNSKNPLLLLVVRGILAELENSKNPSQYPEDLRTGPYAAGNSLPLLVVRRILAELK